MQYCPTCGGSFKNTDKKFEYFLTQLTKNQRTAFDALKNRFNMFVSVNEIADAVYYDDPDGGVLNTQNAISQLIRILRKKLTGTGLSIESRIGRSGGYRLHYENEKDQPNAN